MPSPVRRRPAACLADCAATGRPALRHRLTRTTAGKLALPEQVVLCSQTGDVILRIDAAVSAVSGAVVRADRTVLCELTGDRTLPGEAARSAVSGRLARRDRLVASGLSGRLGFPDEAVACRASGRAVLRDEAVQSAVTSEWFATDTLEPSAVSGGRVPPPDLVACDLTGDRVLTSELQTCAVTGRRVRADRLVRCAASGRPLLADAAGRTDDGRTAHPDEIGVCEWQGRQVLRSELGSCGLTGLTVAVELLADGELVPLRQALDGAAAVATPGELAAIRRAAGLAAASAGWVVRSPHSTGDLAAVCGECRGWLGLRSRFHGAVYGWPTGRGSGGRCRASGGPACGSGETTDRPPTRIEIGRRACMMQASRTRSSTG